MNQEKILQTLELAETELKSCYRKLGILESNVIKDIVEAQQIVKNCSIPDVAGRSEQLKCMMKRTYGNCDCGISSCIEGGW